MDKPYDQLPSPVDNDQNPFSSPLAVEARGSEYITRSHELLNPWISMWMRPRATVRQIIDTDPRNQVLLLAALGGISGALDNATNPSDDLAFRMGVLVGVMIVGAIIGILWLYLYGWLVGIAGRTIGGIGTALEARTAIAWSQIPTIWLLPISLGLAVVTALVGVQNVYGDALAEVSTGNFAAMPPWLILLAIVGVVVTMWQIVITCQSIGEAHQMSSVRGFGALILSGLMMTGIALVIALPFIILFAVFASQSA